MKVVYFRIIAYLCLTFTKQFMKRIIVSILLVSMCVMGPAAFAQANKLSVAQQGEVSIVNNTLWQPKHRHTLWYTEPAKVWMTSALPLGNGQLGACVMGGVKCDEVQFNEKTLWRGHVGSVTDHSAYGSYLDFGHLYITDTDPPYGSFRLPAVARYRRCLCRGGIFSPRHQLSPRIFCVISRQCVGGALPGNERGYAEQADYTAQRQWRGTAICPDKPAFGNGILRRRSQADGH